MADHPPLTDLIGLDPDFTGGLSGTDHLAQQRCGREHPDETAIRADERRKVAEEIAAGIIQQAAQWRANEALSQDQERLFAVAARVAREIGGRA